LSLSDVRFFSNGPLHKKANVPLGFFPVGLRLTLIFGVLKNDALR
jgi:hypothetical protein